MRRGIAASMRMAKPMVSTEVPAGYVHADHLSVEGDRGPAELPAFSPHLRAPLLPTVPAAV
jgi:hypothetical protein